MTVGKVLLLAKQRQVHAEKTRGAGLEVTQKYTKKHEMRPITFVGSLCNIHAALCSKIADVHGIEVHDVRTWKFDYFRSIFRFLLHYTRVVTRGQGAQFPGRRITAGAKKSQQCHKQGPN